jgi:hypothetical protein
VSEPVTSPDVTGSETFTAAWFDFPPLHPSGRRDSDEMLCSASLATLQIETAGRP